LSTKVLDDNITNFTDHKNQDSRQRQREGNDHIYANG